jgi:hypothetical protein
MRDHGSELGWLGFQFASLRSCYLKANFFALEGGGGTIAPRDDP